MSYKKFEDIQYLYENIDGQDSDIEDLSNLIIEKLISEGYSDNAINSFMETADEFALQEKIMQLDEKDLSKIKKGIDLLRRFGKSAITRLRRNTPVNVRKNINRKGTQVKDGLNKAKDAVVNNVKANPKKSSAIALSGLTASAIASREKNNKDKTDDTGTKSGTFKDSQGKEFPTTDTIRGTKPDPNAGRLTYSKSKGQGNQTVVTNPNRQGGEKAKKILDKKSSDAKIDKQVDKYVADRKVPINRDLTIDKSEEGKAKYAEKAAERAAKETEKKVEKVETPKPVKMSNLERQNRARFGDTEIDRLKTKQTDFRKMQSKDMSKDDFIKKYPKSITAQKAAGLRDHFDAFDIVLGYLEETQQADSLDEALYIMMEMDAATIQGIVRDSEFITEEEYDRQKDRQLERGGAGAGDGDNPSTRKPNYGSKQTDAQKKKSQENSKKAFNTVVDRLRNKYGNNAIVTNSHLKTAKKKKEEAKNK